MINIQDIEIGSKIEVTIYEGFNCTPRNIIAEVVGMNFNGVFIKAENWDRKFIHKGNVVRILDS